MKNIYLIFALLLFTSCSRNQQNQFYDSSHSSSSLSNTSSISLPIQKLFSEDILGYQLQLPPELIFQANGKAGQVFDTWNVNKSSTLKDYSVEFYNSGTNCSPTTLGVSKPTDISTADTKTLWGKVDFWKIYGGAQGYIDYDGPHPICNEGNGENGAAYALCSEKDGKTVLICISQVSDNPGIATQIFDSFKWTK